jgi:cell division protein FtsL
MKLRLALIAMLGCALIASALGVVYSKHESRRLFTELQRMEAERDRMDDQWGRLQIEQSTLATHTRIEALAREKLGMAIPAPQSVVIADR